MVVVIDTDILIDLLRNKNYAVKIIKKLETSEEIATTDINAFELYYGAYYSKKRGNISSTKGLLRT